MQDENEIVNPGRPQSWLLPDDGTWPNNQRCPLLAYQCALDLSHGDLAMAIERLFRANHWGGSWRNGVYSFHHYHSTAHEVLGVYGGSARVQLGGEGGVTLELRRGDVIVIPAGVAHKNLGATPDFRVVGAYPLGTSPDMNEGRPDERPEADANIAKLVMPSADPVYGEGGPLLSLWAQATA